MKARLQTLLFLFQSCIQAAVQSDKGMLKTGAILKQILNSNLYYDFCQSFKASLEIKRNLLLGKVWHLCQLRFQKKYFYFHKSEEIKGSCKDFFKALPTARDRLLNMNAVLN